MQNRFPIVHYQALW